MGIFSGLKRGGDKKKKAAKYHESQPGIAEKDILNQAFLGDDPYLRSGAPAKLFPGNEGFRPHDYRPGTPGSDIDSIYGAPAHGSGYGSNHGSRQQSPAVLQPPQFSQFSNNSALNLPSRPWSSSTTNGPQDDRPSTSHGPGTKQWGSNATTFESRFNPVHRRTDTQGTATPASRPGSRAGSVAGIPQSPQSPRSPAHSSRHTKSQISNMDKNLSTSSASPTENSETSQHTSATATTTSEGQCTTSPPSTVSEHSRPTSPADKIWPVANDGSPVSKIEASLPVANSPTVPRDTRARDAAKKKDLAIKVPRRRSWSAQINQLEKAWLEEQLDPKYQNAQARDAQLEVSEKQEHSEEKDFIVPEDKQAAPASPAHVTAPPQNSLVKEQQRLPPQDFPQQRPGMPRQSPRTPQGPMPGPRGHMTSQSAQHFPIRRGPPPPPNGRSFDHSFDASFDPHFNPRNMSRNDPRGDTRFNTRAASRQGPRQMPPPPPGGQRDRGRAVDYNFMPSSIDQYGGVSGGPYDMGRTSRTAPPGVQMPDISAPAPRSASGGAHRHRPMLSDIDISTIDVGGRMPETRLPAALRGSQSMQQLPRLSREARGPMPMSTPHAQNPNQNQYHSRAGSMASQMSQGSHYSRGYPHPQQQHGMRSTSAQGKRSPQYPMPLPNVSMREGGSRYPTGGPNQGPSQGSGPGPRRLAHSSSADLTVYRDQHHQYGPARSPMGSPGYGPGPRSGPNPGPGQGLDQSHPHQQFSSSLDRRNLEPRSDNRVDPRYLNMPSPVSPGAFDRQLSDVAEDIEEKSVLDMPGVAVKDFASKKDSIEPAAPTTQDREVSGASGPNAQSIPSDSPPPYSPAPNTAAVATSVGPAEQLPAVAESEAEVQEQIAPAVVVREKVVEPVESTESIEEAVPVPIESEVDLAEPTPAAVKTTPKRSYVEPTRGISPAYSNSSSTEKSVSTRPLSPAFTNFPLTPVTPSVEKMPTHAVSNSISFSQTVDESARSTAERSPERSQAIAERRRTRYPTRDNNTPPDTPIVDDMPPSPVYVAPVIEANEDTDEVEDVQEHEHDDENADISTTATTLSIVDVSRPQTPAALTKEDSIEIEAEEAEVVSQSTEDVEEAKQVDIEAVEPESTESEAVIETGRAEIAEATAAPIVVESAGADIVETVVAVHPRSGSAATNHSSPPMSPISLPSGDAEPSANANWPLPSVFVSPASRSASPASPTSPSLSLAEAIASPAASVHTVPAIAAPENADSKSIDDTSSEDEKGMEDPVDNDRLMGALPSPTRKTAFTASIYAKDIGISPYAFDDATLSSLGAMAKPTEPLTEARAAGVDANATFHVARPTTPTRNNVSGNMAISSPESTYSWGGDEVIAVTPTRQSGEIAEANDKVEDLKPLEAPQTTGLAEAAEMVKTGEKRGTGLMDVPPESIGLARGPSILADMGTLSPRGKRRWNIAHHAGQETLHERLMEVASPAVHTEAFAAIVPTSPTSTSPTIKAKKGPPPPLTSVPQFNRHVPTDVVDKFGTTFI